jgi:hypothetical protein
LWLAEKRFAPRSNASLSNPNLSRERISYRRQLVDVAEFRAEIDQVPVTGAYQKMGGCLLRESDPAPSGFDRVNVASRSSAG